MVENVSVVCVAIQCNLIALPVNIKKCNQNTINVTVLWIEQGCERASIKGETIFALVTSVFYHFRKECFPHLNCELFFFSLILVLRLFEGHAVLKALLEGRLAGVLLPEEV